MDKNQPPEVFCKKGVLRNFAKFTGKHLCQSLFFQWSCKKLLKKKPWHRCFPVNFAKFLRTPFVKEQLRWLLLQVIGGLVGIIDYFASNVFRVNNKQSSIFICLNSRNGVPTICEICSKLTIKTPEQRQWPLSGGFIVNFEQILQIVTGARLLTFSKRC